MVMKYFTNDWFFSRLSEEDMEKLVEQYSNYISSVFEKLPFVLKMLVKSVNLHDGIIVTSSLEEKNVLALELFCGDLQSGYFLLNLSYAGISEDSRNLERLERFAEVHAAELEVVSDVFCHKLLLSSGSEIEIKFSDVSLRICSKTAKDYKDVKSLKKQMIG